MSSLKNLEDLGLHVGWRTALIGWDGPAALERQIDSHQVVDLAVRKLEQSAAVALEVVQLAGLTRSEYGEVDRLLRFLADEENAAVNLELRKWRLLLLNKLLEELPEAPLYAWIQLAGFWNSFGSPDDCPTIIMRFEAVPEEKRYVVQMREKLLADHKEWLTTEHSAIRAADAG